MEKSCIAQPSHVLLIPFFLLSLYLLSWNLSYSQSLYNSLSGHGTCGVLRSYLISARNFPLPYRWPSRPSVLPSSLHVNVPQRHSEAHARGCPRAPWLSINGLQVSPLSYLGLVSVPLVPLTGA